jgi:hypothetical protein
LLIPPVDTGRAFGKTLSVAAYGGWSADVVAAGAMLGGAELDAAVGTQDEGGRAADSVIVGRSIIVPVLKVELILDLDVLELDVLELDVLELDVLELDESWDAVAFAAANAGRAVRASTTGDDGAAIGVGPERSADEHGAKYEGVRHNEESSHVNSESDRPSRARVSR